MEGRAETPHEMLLINGLAKVTNDPILQSAGADVVIWIGRHKDRRNCIPRIDEVSVELESGNCGHMDVGDQTGGFDKARRCEEIGRRWESLDAVAQRPHEPSHGLAKELVILDDRDQRRFRHTDSDRSLKVEMRARKTSARPRANLVACAGECALGGAAAP